MTIKISTIAKFSYKVYNQMIVKLNSSLSANSAEAKKEGVSMQFFFTLIIYPLYLIIELIFSLALRITGNTGVSVIAVSIGVTLLCLPLYAVAEKWQEIERQTQKKMKPGLDRIKKAFEGDERYMMTQTFYRENRYSPIMGLRSSFGLLIQIPFFIAAYTFLSHLDALKGQSFLFIRDMGKPDNLFSIGTFQVNVLPVAMTIINMISGFIYTKGHSVREQIQVYGMAVIFLVILYNSPAGLVLYWTMNNVFGMIKNIFYKFKRPLRTFWVTSLVFLGILSITLFVNANTNTPKFAALLMTVLTAAIPFILRASKKIFANTLDYLKNFKKQRLILFFLSCCVLFVLTGLLIPSSLISSSPTEFSGIGSHPNPLWYIANTTKKSAGLCIIWPICIYFLFSPNVQAALVLVFSFLTLSTLVNAFIFMPAYGDISSSLTFLDAVDFKTISPSSMLNLFVILALGILIPLTLRAKGTKILSSIFAVILCASTIASFANIAGIKKSYTAYVTNIMEHNLDKIEPIYHLSKKGKNVVVIMLDRAQSRYVDEIMKEHTDLQKEFDGFTLYENTVSFNGHTLQGAPGIWGGYEYTPAEMNARDDTPLKEKNNESILVLPRIFTEELKYSATITDPSWGNYNTLCDLSFLESFPLISGYKTIGTYTDKWMSTNNTEETLSDFSGNILERNLLFFSFFRESPIILREFIYKKGKYWNSNENMQDTKIVLDNYSALAFLPELTEFTDSEQGTYICTVNELSHEDLFLQAPDYTPSDSVTDYGTSKYSRNPDFHTQSAAFMLIGKWLKQLKDNGAYDNTRIILVSDHSRGPQEEAYEKDDELDLRIAGSIRWGRGKYHPLLLFKDFDEKGSLNHDETFMTNADVPSLVLKNLLENPKNPFTGNLIPLDTKELKKNGVIISTSDNEKPSYNGKYKFSIRDNEWWLVKDNIFKSANWTQISPEQINNQ